MGMRPRGFHISNFFALLPVTVVVPAMSLAILFVTSLSSQSFAGPVPCFLMLKDSPNPLLRGFGDLAHRAHHGGDNSGEAGERVMNG